MRFDRLGRAVFWPGFLLSMVLLSVCFGYYFHPEYRPCIESLYADDRIYSTPPDPYRLAIALFFLINLPAGAILSRLGTVLLALFDPDQPLRAQLVLASFPVTALLWWYFLAHTAMGIHRAIERRRAARDTSRDTHGTGRPAPRWLNSVRLCRVGWLVFSIGIVVNTALLSKMAAYHFEEERTHLVEIYYTPATTYPPLTRGHAIANSSFVIMNPPVEGMLFLLRLLTDLFFGISYGLWRADIVLGGRAVFSLLWWYVLGLAATRLQGAMARRRAARDPSPAAAPDDGSGDAG